MAVVPHNLTLYAYLLFCVTDYILHILSKFLDNVSVVITIRMATMARDPRQATKDPREPTQASHLCAFIQFGPLCHCARPPAFLHVPQRPFVCVMASWSLFCLCLCCDAPFGSTRSRDVRVLVAGIGPAGPGGVHKGGPCAWSHHIAFCLLPPSSHPPSGIFSFQPRPSSLCVLPSCALLYRWRSDRRGCLSRHSSSPLILCSSLLFLSSSCRLLYLTYCLPICARLLATTFLKMVVKYPTLPRWPLCGGSVLGSAIAQVLRR